MMESSTSIPNTQIMLKLSSRESGDARLFHVSPSSRSSSWLSASIPSPIHVLERIQDATFSALIEEMSTHGVQVIALDLTLENVEHCGGEPERTDTGILCHWWVDEWCDIFKTFNVQCKLTRWTPHYVTPCWWIHWMRQTPHSVCVVYHWA